jgi:hypothetical protein
MKIGLLSMPTLSEASKLKYFFASVMLETQQFEGIWPLDAPFSRVPRGGQALTSAPSWLDWGLASEGRECPSKISWRDVPADHAWILWELKLQFKPTLSALPPPGDAKTKRSS